MTPLLFFATIFTSVTTVAGLLAYPGTRIPFITFMKVMWSYIGTAFLGIALGFAWLFGSIPGWIVAIGMALWGGATVAIWPFVRRVLLFLLAAAAFITIAMFAAFRSGNWTALTWLYWIPAAILLPVAWLVNFGWLWFLTSGFLIGGALATATPNLLYVSGSIWTILAWAVCLALTLLGRWRLGRIVLFPVVVGLIMLGQMPQDSPTLLAMKHVFENQSENTAVSVETKAVEIGADTTQKSRDIVPTQTDEEGTMIRIKLGPAPVYLVVINSDGEAIGVGDYKRDRDGKEVLLPQDSWIKAWEARPKIHVGFDTYVEIQMPDKHGDFLRSKERLAMASWRLDFKSPSKMAEMRTAQSGQPTPVVNMTPSSADCAAASAPAEYVALVDKYLPVYQMTLHRNLVLALITVESSWNPRKESMEGAQGLMQIMPATARDLGITNPFDPEQNIRGGIQYLAQQLRDFSGTELALGAYNAGPKFVLDRPGKSWGEIASEAPGETGDYVPRIISLARCQSVSPTALVASATTPAIPAARAVEVKTIEYVSFSIVNNLGGNLVARPNGKEPGMTHVKINKKGGHVMIENAVIKEWRLETDTGQFLKNLYPKGGEIFEIG